MFKKLFFLLIFVITFNTCCMDISFGNYLLEATRWNDTTVADLLIDLDLCIDAVNSDGETALILAVKKGNKQITDSLINKTVNLNRVDKNGNTALIWASILGYKDIAEVLILAGADLDIQNFDGDTALSIAEKLGHLQTAKLLCDAITAKSLFVHKIDCSIESSDILTATEEDNAHAVLELILSGANVNSRNACGETPLIIAAIKNHVLIAKMLVTAGADKNLKARSGKTAFAWAVKYDHVEILEALMDLKSVDNENGS